MTVNPNFVEYKKHISIFFRQNPIILITHTREKALLPWRQLDNKVSSVAETRYT